MAGWPVGGLGVDQRETGDRIRSSAKVQIGAELLCKSAKVESTSGDGHGSRRLRRRHLGHQPREPEPAAEGRTADTCKAEAPMAVTRHLRLSLRSQPPTANRQHLTFAPLHRPQADLHFCTSGPTRLRRVYSVFPAAKSASESATHWRCSPVSSGKMGMLRTSLARRSDTGTLSKPRYFWSTKHC